MKYTYVVFLFIIFGFMSCQPSGVEEQVTTGTATTTGSSTGGTSSGGTTAGSGGGTGSIGSGATSTGGTSTGSIGGGTTGSGGTTTGGGTTTTSPPPTNPLDLDNDGIEDLKDNCPPPDANPLQSDFDGDVIGDKCDVCSDMAKPTPSNYKITVTRVPALCGSDPHAYFSLSINGSLFETQRIAGCGARTMVFLVPANRFLLTSTSAVSNTLVISVSSSDLSSTNIQSASGESEKAILEGKQMKSFAFNQTFGGIHSQETISLIIPKCVNVP